MKRGTPDHPKTIELQLRLAETAWLSRVPADMLQDVAHHTAVSVLEELWQWTAKYVHDGGVGRLSDARIAYGAKWKGDPAELIDALVGSGYLDKRPADCRLYVHDWHEHAEDAVNVALYRAIRRFANGAMPKASRLNLDERAKLEEAWSESVRTESAQDAHAVRTPCAQLRSAPPRLGSAPPVEQQQRVPHDPANRTHVDVLQRLEAAAPLCRDDDEPEGLTPAELLAKLSRTPRGAVITDLRDASAKWIRRTAVQLTTLERQLLARGAHLEPAINSPPDDQAANTWCLVLAGVQAAIPAEIFATLFRPTSGVAFRGDVLVVRVPNANWAMQLRKTYRDVVADAARAAGLTCRVEYMANERKAAG